jgi:hypothetical protein
VNVIDREKRLCSRAFGSEMRDQLARVSNAVADAIGVGLGVTVTLPVALVLEPLKFLKLFLNQLFGACVLLIIALASMAIYSLLISDVEQSTYEFGMLRALGLDVRSLGVLIAARAAYFTLPSLAIGIALAQLGSLVALSYLYDFIGAERNFAMNEFAAWLAITVGVTMPIIGSYVPTMSALRASLSDSLDVYKQTSASVSVVATRLENLGVSSAQLAVGTGLVFIGFVVYLLIPYAFVIRDFDLMFTALNSLIIVVVMGLVTLSTTAQSLLEKMLVYMVMAFTPDKRFISLVLKNLAAHRSRNQKTVLMFTVAITFVVFVGSIFFLQGASIESNLRVAFGADIVVCAARSRQMCAFRNRVPGTRAGPTARPTCSPFPTPTHSAPSIWSICRSKSWKELWRASTSSQTLCSLRTPGSHRRSVGTSLLFGITAFRTWLLSPGSCALCCMRYQTTLARRCALSS